MGGIARVSQVQLLQLFLTLVFAALLNGDVPGAGTWAFGALVVGVVALGGRTAVATVTTAARGTTGPIQATVPRGAANEERP